VTLPYFLLSPKTVCEVVEVLARFKGCYWWVVEVPTVR
jgi:hypothetical protein